MHFRANGILRGSRIELEHPLTDLPDGSSVSLVLSPRDVSVEEKHSLIDELCGAWKDDPSLAPIFEEIAQNRNQSSGRLINLNDPA